jgi:hypothetical protein
MNDEAPDSEYISMLIEFTKSSFINKTGVPPVFIYEKDGDVQPIKVPTQLVDSEEGKNDLANMIASAVSTFKPDSHCFVSEAWAYKMDNFDTKEEAMKAFADFKNGISSDKITREEVVTFAFTKINPDQTTERWMGNLPFTRDAEDRISGFDHVRWIKSDESKKMEGRLFNN